MHIYLLEIPDLDVGQLADSGGLDVDTDDILNEIGTAKAISSPPNTIDPPIKFDGADATMRAFEVHELLNSPHHAPLPVSYPIPGYDGYYVANGATRNTKLSEGGDTDYERIDVDLTRVGTDGKMVRALEAGPYMADHEFGNDLEVVVALPADAQKVRWLDRDTGDRELADPVETVATAYGDIDVYDLEGSLGYEFDPDDPPDAPLLVYEIGKDQDANGDVRLWDTRGTESLESDGRRQWQHIFSKDHEYDGYIVLDNGLLRLWLDEDDGTVDAQEWDDGDEEWADLELADAQPSDVSLFDVDIQSIGMVRERVQITLDVDGDLFALDTVLLSGADAVLFSIPDGETGPIPEDVEDWLEPIASESIVDAQAAKTLVSRSEVSK